jgi:predicted signal transduction protein with EAL and GGDEF domain
MPTEELLRETDAALYRAKAAGKNCVRLATPQAAITGATEADQEKTTRAADLAKIDR